jgi:hypothetical protein
MLCRQSEQPFVRGPNFGLVTPGPQSRTNQPVVLPLAFAKSTEPPGSEIGRNRETLTLDFLERSFDGPSLPSPTVHATWSFAQAAATCTAG